MHFLFIFLTFSPMNFVHGTFITSIYFLMVIFPADFDGCFCMGIASKTQELNSNSIFINKYQLHLQHVLAERRIITLVGYASHAQRYQFLLDHFYINIEALDQTGNLAVLLQVAGIFSFAHSIYYRIVLQWLEDAIFYLF